MLKKQTAIPRLDICTLSDYREDDLMISRLSDYLIEHQNLVFPHRHSFYHLVFFTKGSGSHTIDFQSFPVKNNQIYFMAPGQVHAWHFEGEMEGFVVNFSGTFFQSFLLRQEYLESFFFLNSVTEDAVLNMSDELTDEVNIQFETLLQQSRKVGSLQVDMIRLILLQIFITIEHGHPHPSKLSAPLQNAVIRSFLKLIETNFIDKRLPGNYSEMLHVSPNHLNALAKEHLGKQAGEVIRERVLLEAKRLLIMPELTVAEIAYRLNFNDNSYFTRFFRKYAGMTPEAFRLNAVNN
ncbi:MAG TPA: helix-turn-helix transcriptional regulator [Dyadobacter sp.]|jgi:AraC-like DNA-binding protein|nr:helix-turn-helix transcriptional regulator [Dyadobacter sp.]